MNFLPQFELSITNAFWFSLLFVATNLVILKAYPSHYKKRVLTMPKFDNRLQQLIGKFNFVLFQGLITLVIFMPVQFDKPFIIIGLSIFFLGYIAYLMSLINYATSNPDKPVTKGIFRFSRNPQQISTIIMWGGIGFITSCSLIIVVCLIQIIAVYPTFIAQEKFCIEKYGDDYIEYMRKTPRYILLNS